MRKTLMLIVLLLCTAIAVGQETPKDSIKHNPPALSTDGVQSVPEYRGGLKAFYNFIGPKIQRSICYTPGRMLVTFVVEKDGSLSNIKTLKGISDKFDERVREIIAKSPKWKPGTQENKPVRVQYNLPITFN